MGAKEVRVIAEPGIDVANKNIRYNNFYNYYKLLVIGIIYCIYANLAIPDLNIPTWSPGSPSSSIA